MKIAYKLNTKAYRMNNFEKQNVQSVVNVIHESTCAGLRSIENREDMKNCANFLELIRNWFNANNVKSIEKDRNRRDRYSAPIYSADDHSIKFMIQFLEFLNRWNALSNGNKLTKDTFFAIYTSTLVTIEASKYFLQMYKLKYILTGKN